MANPWGGLQEGNTMNSPFNPPIIATIVLVAIAFLFVTYYKFFFNHFRPCLPCLQREGETEGATYPVVNDSEAFLPTVHPSGFNETWLQRIPMYQFTDSGGRPESKTDCAVCLGKFSSKDLMRVLPLCNHIFHMSCVDVWLRGHTSCPLCRAYVGVAPELWPHLPGFKKFIQYEEEGDGGGYGLGDFFSVRMQVLEEEERRRREKGEEEERSEIEERKDGGDVVFMKRCFSLGSIEKGRGWAARSRGPDIDDIEAILSPRVRVIRGQDH
ncbi:RING-H2 finger protein ATL52 [Amborella trichopoda]|uniref:RING-type E3 ubiquitin transferase n=1 Tax=Amborella trichopoda TaxID=13333 RepID=W1P878_AMBTC|nr:RING-H2 finger protein ATL52 [Amborella trichopoda]ERN04143.1 hypothetical protein AMTR_s00077p00070720 [Amborella trichopoda]|eukprot:XP_020521818.1 RING-H2 finger protein ATL52 [Amborella trichopoda]